VRRVEAALPGRTGPVMEADLPDSAALPALAQLEEQLGAMSGQHNAHLWHAGALTSRAEWGSRRGRKQGKP